MSEESKTPSQEIGRCQRPINVFKFPSDTSTVLTNEADLNPFIDTNLNSRISKSHVTLLSRQYHYVLPSTLLIYTCLQYFIGSKSNICSTYREPASESTNVVYYCAGTCFFMSGLQQLVKIYSHRNQSVGCMSRSIFLAALTVSLIAGSSSYLTAATQYGGICKDMLGVESVCGQWAEWLTSVPLIVYMTIAVEDKLALDGEDYVIIGSCVACILFGFVMNFSSNENNHAGVTLLFLSFAAIGVTGICLSNIAGKKLHTMGRDNMADNKDLTQRLKMKSIARLLLWVFPFFGIIYILGWRKLLERNGVFVGYQACGLIAKLLFVGNLTEAHLGIFEAMNIQLAAMKLANTTRRNFLRYVFHEVRVPLNTIAMGITVVRDDCDSRVWTDATREALLMMDGATNFMSDTLNDVLSMDKIEEGAMQLNISEFNMEDVFSVSVNTIKGNADAKKISIGLRYGEEKPLDQLLPLKSSSDPTQIIGGRFMGDRFRIEHVIVNFLSNAVKFSPIGSQIVIQMTESDTRSGVPLARDRNAADREARGLKRSDSKDKKKSIWSRVRMSQSPERSPKTSSYREVTVKIMDTGIGISKSDLAGLFNAYSQVRPEQLQQGRGSGLGLVLAKEIISMHGGSVIVESEEGMGSAFGFRIPFELATSIPEIRHVETTEHTNSRLPFVRTRSSCESQETVVEGTYTGLGDAKDDDCTVLVNPCIFSAAPSAFSSYSRSNRSSMSVSTMASNPPSKSPSSTNSCDVSDSEADFSSANFAIHLFKTCLIVDGIKSEIVENGQEAVDAVANRGERFDVIFMDHTMPIMTGTDASRQIRKDGFRRLIFGITGNALDDDVAEFLSAGADCVIAKPLRANSIDAILDYVTRHGFQSDPSVRINMQKTTNNGCKLKKLPYPASQRTTRHSMLSG